MGQTTNVPECVENIELCQDIAHHDRHELRARLRDLDARTGGVDLPIHLR